MVTGIPGTKKLLYQFSKGDASMTALLGGKGSNLCEMVTGIPGTKKLLYQFSKGDASMTALLGGKGSNLCEMVRLGLPVPPGFISTETCLDYFKQDNHLPDGLAQDMRSNVGQVEAAMDRKFGSVERPLLVAVRSGARVSMPGMMDTILNLGINDSIVKGLASEMGDPRPALDAYRRFLQIYADVVMEVESGVFEEILSHHKEQSGITEDHQLTPETLNQVITEFKNAIRQATGTDIPVDPWDQLMSATEAVFRSWNNPRAIFYRNHNGIDHNMGTAVTIMAMVFGTLVPPAERACSLPGTHQPGSARSTVSSCPMPKARTWWPVSALLSRFPLWQRLCPKLQAS
jgi:pyruvate,orthophosphate dikinase